MTLKTPRRLWPFPLIADFARGTLWAPGRSDGGRARTRRRRAVPGGGAAGPRGNGTTNPIDRRNLRCHASTTTTSSTPTTRRRFEPTSKRRHGYPSETRVKRGPRSIKCGEVELFERLGNSDPCPCGSGRRFQELLSQHRPLLTAPAATTTTGSAEQLPLPGPYRLRDPASV